MANSNKLASTDALQPDVNYLIAYVKGRLPEKEVVFLEEQLRENGSMQALVNAIRTTLEGEDDDTPPIEERLAKSKQGCADRIAQEPIPKTTRKRRNLIKVIVLVMGSFWLLASQNWHRSNLQPPVRPMEVKPQTVLPMAINNSRALDNPKQMEASYYQYYVFRRLWLNDHTITVCEQSYSVCRYRPGQRQEADDQTSLFGMNAFAPSLTTENSQVNEHDLSTPYAYSFQAVTHLQLDDPATLLADTGAGPQPQPWAGPRPDSAEDALQRRPPDITERIVCSFLGEADNIVSARPNVLPSKKKYKIVITRYNQTDTSVFFISLDSTYSRQATINNYAIDKNILLPHIRAMYLSSNNATLINTSPMNAGKSAAPLSLKSPSQCTTSNNTKANIFPYSFY